MSINRQYDLGKNKTALYFQFVYWGDEQEKSIYRGNLDGSRRSVFLNATDGIGYVEGQSRRIFNLDAKISMLEVIKISDLTLHSAFFINIVSFE